MVTIYPARIDSILTLPTVVDNATAVKGEVINRLRDAIIAIEAELGVKPSGTFTTVRARLDNIEGIVNQILAGGGGGGGGNVFFGGDLVGNNVHQSVIGFQGRPFSSAAPLNGQVIGWNGSTWLPQSSGGDVSGPFTGQTVIALQSNPVSSGVLGGPDANKFLGWTGSTWLPQFVTSDQIQPAYEITLLGQAFAELGQIVVNPIFAASYSQTPTTSVISDNLGSPTQNVLTTPSPSTSNLFFYNQQYFSINGTTASLAFSTPTITLTGGNGFTAADVGNTITISGATTPGNNGPFVITAFISATSVQYTNASGATDANNGHISWFVEKVKEYGFSVLFTLTSSNGPKTAQATNLLTWTQNLYFGSESIPGSYNNAFVKALPASFLGTTKSGNFTVNAGPGQAIFYAYRSAYDNNGSTASLSSFSSPTVTLTGGSGFTANDVGKYITIRNAATVANNGSYLITAFNSATSISYSNPSGVAPDANNGSIQWVRNADFWIDGFEGGFTLVATVSVTNNHGFTENYNLYQSDQLGLGLTTVYVF